MWAQFSLLSIFLFGQLSKMDTSGIRKKGPSFRESYKGSKAKQGPALGVQFAV